MSAQSKTITWAVLIGGAGLIAYLLYKKTAATVSAAATTVGSTLASPFEALYTAVTGNSPTNLLTGAQYFVYDQNGALTYDSNGNPVITSSPPSTPGNPYPNPNAGG